jgi:hypothetical protein
MSTPLVSVAYTHDAVGDITSRDDLLADAAVSAATPNAVGQDLTYSYDTMHRLTGYSLGTLNTTTHNLSSTTLTTGWYLDSNGNRYTASGIFATTYTPANQSTNSLYFAGGNQKQVTFDSSDSVTLSYDSWGRVASSTATTTTYSNDQSSTTTVTTRYSYDALGRMIATSTLPPGSGIPTGTQTYYDGANPIIVREFDNTTQLMRYVWSPADGRMILRDAVASQLSSDTGLTGITANSFAYQRLYPMTDALGNIVAVAAPTGVVLERYVYTADGTPTALNSNWSTVSAVGNYSIYTSQFAWNWFYRGEQWVQTSFGSAISGLFLTPSGRWYDSLHAVTLQPDPAANGSGNPYKMSALETFGATVAPLLVGVGAGLAVALTGGFALPLLGFAAAGELTLAGTLIVGVSSGLAGGAATAGVGSYTAGGSAGQVAQSTLIGGVAGALGGAAGAFSGIGARAALSAAGLTCEAGYGAAAAFAVGAAEGGAFGATQGFVQTGLMTGNLVDAVMAGWNGGLMGVAIGGPLGAIFHQVCFVAGTQVLARPGDETENRPDLLFGVRRAGGSGDPLQRPSVRGPSFSLPALPMKPNHPLYVVGKGWTPVCEIKPGNTLMAVDESVVTVAPAASHRYGLRYVDRNIEDILPGDYILSRNQNDPYGPLVYSRVDKVYRRLADHLRILSIRDFSAREQTLKTTDDHPYYVPGKGWVKAGNLEVGDVFFGLDGTCGVLLVTAREEHPESVWVYNLRVEGTHTYFVREQGVDAEPVWVHNANYPTAAGGTGAAYDELNGQGVYVLRNPTTGEIEYVGRGDAPDRLFDHAALGSGKDDLDGEILFNNNLSAPQAQSLEQELMHVLGGPKSINPATTLRNQIQGIAESNPNFLQREFAADDELFFEALRRVKLL